MQWQLYKYFYQIEFYLKDTQFQVMYSVLKCTGMSNICKEVFDQAVSELKSEVLFFLFPEFLKQISYRYDITKQYMYDTIQCLLNVYYVYYAVYKLRYI